MVNGAALKRKIECKIQHLDLFRRQRCTMPSNAWLRFPLFDILEMFNYGHACYYLSESILLNFVVKMATKVIASWTAEIMILHGRVHYTTAKPLWRKGIKETNEM